MSIEQRLNSDQEPDINIHDLTIETPEKKSEAPFDVDRDITPEDWIEIDTLIKEYKDLGVGARTEDLFRLYTDIKILSPDRKLDVTPEELEWLRNQIDKEMERGSWHRFIEDMFEIIILGNRPKSLKLEDYQEMFSAMLGKRTLFDIARLRVVYPELFDLPGDLLNHLKRDITNFREGKKWDIFITHAAYVRMLDPTIDLDIKGSEWEEIKKYTHLQLGVGRGTIFLNCARNLAILAAKEVIVDKNGITLIKSNSDSSFNKQSVPLLEVKKF